jgi:hypothetical protein
MGRAFRCPTHSFWLLLPIADTDRGPDLPHKNPAIRHPLYDGVVHHHRFFHRSRDCCVAMGIGFGAAYPDFKAENPAQTVTSFGGLVFMIVCAGDIGLVILKVRSKILPLDG